MMSGRLTDLGIRVPVVLAPMAGGPSTPELCAAVSEEGGLPFFAAGYLSAGQLQDRLDELKGMTDRPFGVNLFVPDTDADPVEGDAYRRYRDRIVTLGFAEEPELPQEPVWSDDDYTAKLEVALASPAAFVSFTFGHPIPEVVDQVHTAGKKVVLNATSPSGIQAALQAGADVLVVQGAGAGGHRASVPGTDDDAFYETEDLVRQATALTELPVFAAGGVAGAVDVSRLLAAGATAVQVGTLFLLANEAGTKETHREALTSLRDRDTVVTSAFTGRPARAVVNRFITEMEGRGESAPAAYPALHFLTSGLRKRADTEGNAELLNLWAGTGFRHAVSAPAGDIVRGLYPGNGE